MVLLVDEHRLPFVVDCGADVGAIAAQTSAYTSDDPRYFRFSGLFVGPGGTVKTRHALERGDRSRRPPGRDRFRTPGEVAGRGCGGQAGAHAGSVAEASARHRLLLAALVMVWAVSWPVVKIGVADVPPIWFACWRYVIATGCLGVFVASRGELALPSRSDWRLVLVSGMLQMGAFSSLTALALTILPPGRASVLAFSTPIWVVPLAAWRLNERVSRRGLAGIALGLAGALLIALPAFARGGSGQLASYAMLMAAAAAWAISIVFVRGHRFDASPLMLAPWQALVAATVLVPLALVVEGPPPSITGRGAAALAYVGPVATAFAYWAVVEAARRFPASTISVALLATPSLGLLISALALGERASASLVAGILCVAGGIRLVTARGSGTHGSQGDQGGATSEARFVLNGVGNARNPARTPTARRTSA